MLSGTIRSAIVATFLCAVGSTASALGLGDIRAQVFLGQPLNLALPVSLGEGETLSAECASAEVVAGESRLPAGSVRVRVTQGRDASEAILRIATSVPVDEPVINLTVAAGCPARVTRTLVLLADPPLVSPTVVAAPAPSSPAAALPATAPRSEGAMAGTVDNAAATPSRRASPPAPPPRPARSAVVGPRRTAAAPAEAPPAVASAAPPRRSTPAVPPQAAVAPRTSDRPRLQLEGGQVSVAELAVLAAQSQASAARASAEVSEAAASAAQQRVRDLEVEMTRLRADAKAQTDALVQLRLQIAQDQAQGQRQTWLLPALLALAAVLGAVAIWLGLQLREQRQQPRREAWWDKAGPPSRQVEEEESGYRPSSIRPSTQMQTSSRMPSAPAPLSSILEVSPTTMVSPDSMLSPPTVAAPMVVTIPPIPPMPPMTGDSSHAVSVDEQIDLEQQADFFVALGHDESAIDLLMAHLRSTGGGTPLPFLKLLEIHRRRGDREAYERTRVRFNQRFNSVATDWESDPRDGRSLEDYPLVVGRIQHAWPQPLDAMAELEALLFRRGVGSELFDLPAYHEVLFLYQLARDLQQSEAPDATIDVLLPIGGASASTAEGTITLRPEFNAGRALSLDLDLDASLLGRDEGPATGTDVDRLQLDLAEDGAPQDTGSANRWSTDPEGHRRE